MVVLGVVWVVLGVADIDSRLEEQILDGIVYAFQDAQQNTRKTTIL